MAAAALALCSSASAEAATTLHVARGASGNGTAAAPFGRIQDALNAAHAGDTVVIDAGTYAETLRTVRAGSAGASITLRGAGDRGSVVVRANGRVMTVSHPYVTVERLVFDGS